MRESAGWCGRVQWRAVGVGECGSVWVGAGVYASVRECMRVNVSVRKCTGLCG